MARAMMLVLFAGTMVFSQGKDFLKLRLTGTVEYHLGHYPEAESLFREALASAEEMNAQYEMSLNHAALGTVYEQTLRLTDAEQEYRKAISILVKLPERAHALAVMWRNVASVLTPQKRYDEARAALETTSKIVKTHGLRDPVLDAEILNSLGILYFRQGKPGNAKSHFLKALDVKSLPPDDPELTVILNNLGIVYRTGQQYAKAEEAFKRALNIIDGLQQHTPAHLVGTLKNIGTLYMVMGRYGQAEEYLRRALAMMEQPRFPLDQVWAVETVYALGKTYALQNRQTQALPLLRQAAGMVQQNPQLVSTTEAIEILETYSKVLKDLQKDAEAERIHDEASRLRALAEFTVTTRSLTR